MPSFSSNFPRLLSDMKAERNPKQDPLAGEASASPLASGNSRLRPLKLLKQLTGRAPVGGDPDGGLVEAARRGDRRAFDTLVRTHETQLRGFLARRVPSEAVDDLLQDTLVAGWTALPRFDRRARFKAWLYGIAVHKCADYFRGRGRLHELPLEEQVLDPVSPEALYAAAELRETIEQLLIQLPDPQREVVELYYYADLTLAEIAGLLGRNLNTVKYQFYRAHDRVKQGLEPSTPLSPEGPGVARKVSLL